MTHFSNPEGKPLGATLPSKVKNEEDREFNDKWHLASSNRKSFWGVYQRNGESLITGNVGAWYELAVYWRNRADELQNRLNGED